MSAISHLHAAEALLKDSNTEIERERALVSVAKARLRTQTVREKMREHREKGC